jgi:hypothetical protein
MTKAWTHALGMVNLVRAYEDALRAAAQVPRGASDHLLFDFRLRIADVIRHAMRSVDDQQYIR